jgi:hypothetical protein
MDHRIYPAFLIGKGEPILAVEMKIDEFLSVDESIEESFPQRSLFDENDDVCHIDAEILLRLPL